MQLFFVSTRDMTKLSYRCADDNSIPLSYLVLPWGKNEDQHLLTPGWCNSPDFLPEKFSDLMQLTQELERMHAKLPRRLSCPYHEGLEGLFAQAGRSVTTSKACLTERQSNEVILLRNRVRISWFIGSPRNGIQLYRSKLKHFLILLKS